MPLYITCGVDAIIEYEEIEMSCIYRCLSKSKLLGLLMLTISCGSADFNSKDGEYSVTLTEEQKKTSQESPAQPVVVYSEQDKEEFVPTVEEKKEHHISPAPYEDEDDISIPQNININISNVLNSNSTSNHTNKVNRETTHTPSKTVVQEKPVIVEKEVIREVPVVVEKQVPVIVEQPKRPTLVCSKKCKGYVAVYN